MPAPRPWKAPTWSSGTPSTARSPRIWAVRLRPEVSSRRRHRCRFRPCSTSVRSVKPRRGCAAGVPPTVPFIASARAAASPRASRRRERNAMAERLKERYEQQIRGQLQERFGYKNVNQIPRLEKVVVNMSVGEAIVNPKALDAAVSELTAITGQKPVVAKAKKSIAAFKLRAGMNIAAKVTLRGDRMYVFVDKLFNVVLPRIRDFRGLPAKSFDGRGNYNLGLREQLVFPEINYDKVDKTRGMDVTIVTTAKTDEEASEFLVAMGLPLQKTASSTMGPQR